MVEAHQNINSKCSNTNLSFFFLQIWKLIILNRQTNTFLDLIFLCLFSKIVCDFFWMMRFKFVHIFCANLKRLRMQRGLNQNSKFDPSLNLFPQTQALGSTLFCLGWKSKQIAIFRFDYTLFSDFFLICSRKNHRK